MASDVLLIPDRGEIRWIDETVSPQSMSLLGNSQNQLNFVGYTSAFDATQIPTGGTTRVTISDSSTATLVPGASGYELGSSALRWSLNATAINATGIVSLSNTGGANGPQLLFASASAPSSPSDGHMWYSGSALNFYHSGATYNLIGVTIGHPVYSGTAGSILFVDASNSLAHNNANLFWDNSNNRLGIGNATPQIPVDIRVGSSNLLRAVNTNSSGTNEGASLILSQANVGLVVNGNRLGGILIGGASGTNYATQNNAVAIQGYAAQSWTFGSVQGSYLTFETTPSGSATRVERMRIDPDATVWIGNGPLSATPEAAIISATRGLGTNIVGASLTIRSGSGTGTGDSGQLIFQTATAGSSGSGSNAYSNRMTIASNGNITLWGTPGNITWTAATGKLNIDGNGILDHVTISQGGVESITLGHSSNSGQMGGRIYGSGEESGGLEIASVSNIQVITGATGGLEMYPRGTSAGDTGELRFRELAANGVHHIALKAADALTNSVTYVFPSAHPAANQVLTASSISGSGPYTVTLGWTNPSSGGITSLGGQTGATQTFANDTNVTITSSSNTHTLGWTGLLSVGRGGTGAGTFTTNGVLLGNGTSALVVTAAGTANQVFRVPGAGGSPAFGAIDISQSAAVTGTLDVTNGGTGTSTQFTQNNVVFAGASGIYSQSSAFTFTSATGQLALSTTGSGAGILIGGDVQIYRSGANILGVPDTMEIRSANELRFNNAGDTKFSSFAPGAQSITINYTLPATAPALNNVLKATAVSGTDPVTVTLGWSTDTDTGITSLNGQTGTTQTFANDTNITISSSADTHTLGWTGQLAVSRGGTGASTFTSNGVLLGNGTSAINVTAAGTANQVLRVPGAGGAPAFGAIDLSQSAAVTGALGVANGGTGTTTQFTQNNVVFAGASGIYTESNNFTYNTSTGQLALSTTGSGAGVLIGGDVQIYRSGSNILGLPDIVEIRSANALRFNNSGDTKFSSFAPGAQTITINYTLPAAAPALNDVLKATSVSGTDPVTVTLGWAADTDTGITSLGGQTGTTQTFANDTNVTISSSSNTHTLGWTGQLAVGRGGSGAGTFTTNGVLLGNGTSAFGVTAAGTANQVLRIPGAGGAPSFGSIDLAQSAAVTGTLGVANGGTGTGTAFTAGSVIFAGSGGTYSQDNANFFWDDTNDRLGLRTTTPGATLHINPGTGSQAAWNTDGVFLRVQAGTRTNSSTATSGTANFAAFNSFAQPTLAATNTGVTTTNAATVFIANAPAAGTNMTITNPYALWVDAGRSRFNGAVGIGVLPDDNNQLYSFLTTSSNLSRRAIQGLNSVTGSITSTFPVGMSGRIEVNAAANTISYAAGVFGSARTLSGQSGTVTALYGMDYDAWHQGSANIGTMAASRAFSTVTNTSSGTITDWCAYIGQLNMSAGGTNSAVTNAFGYDLISSLSGVSTITNLTGYRMQNPSGSQTITNLYGIRIADLTRGTNNFGIYFDGTSGLARQGVWWNGDTNLYRSAANALKTDDELVVGQRITSGVVVLTDGANISLDASLGNHFRVTLAGNRTLLAPTNAVDGQKITIEVIQDGGGNRTLTLTTGSAGSFIFGTDITGITLTTTGGKRDLIGCVYSSSLDRWMVVSFIKGF